MAEKFYALATKTGGQFKELKRSLTATIKPSSRTIHEPTRRVEQTKDIKHSVTRGEFKLTDEEATALKNDPRIVYIELSSEEYPDLHIFDSSSLIDGTQNSLKSRYSFNPKHYYQFFGPDVDVGVQPFERAYTRQVKISNGFSITGSKDVAGVGFVNKGNTNTIAAGDKIRIQYNDGSSVTEYLGNPLPYLRPSEPPYGEFKLVKSIETSVEGAFIERLFARSFISINDGFIITGSFSMI